jgi:hypothetical protein
MGDPLINAPETYPAKRALSAWLAPASVGGFGNLLTIADTTLLLEVFC